jgi:cellulose synthase/poly-beta-1,6-N-acetylglucosamine synthase-like glycosyltransferase
MTVGETLILSTYFFVLVILAVYGWHRYYLVYLYMKYRDRQPVPAAPLETLPPVTIQLPIYNEMYVADRLIDAVCQIDYPRELLEIQVLDDSTDETCHVAERAVRRNAARGIDITYLHRTDRTGYKAGALEAGMKVAKGEFIAIFDADFIPTTDFSAPHGSLLRRSEESRCAGAVGAHQSGLFAADQGAVDPARRAFRPRAWRPQPLGISSTSTARRASGGAWRLPMPGAGSTIRSPKI